MKYKVGDKIKIVTDSYGEKYRGLIIEVVPEGKCNSSSEGVWLDEHTAEVNWVNETWSVKDFTLVEEEKVKNKFSVGDRVILANPQAASGHDLEEGWIGYVLNPNDGSDDIPVQVAEEKSRIYYYFNEDELELLNAAKQDFKDIKIPHDSVGLSFDDPKMKVTPADFTGIARPVLEERKIGKVKMELFDEGFPNAIMEIARVMTWAAEHKGYKPHDWKQLPNADTEFSAAASRHKVKSFIQKVDGVEALQRTDEESKIVHLAHTAFNVLAELELVLTGVIK